MKKDKWQGYVYSGSINGSIIPQRVQNLVVRSYVEKYDKTFILSGTEYNLDGCTMILRSIIQDFTKLDGLVFYSLHMLPKLQQERLQLYTQSIRNSVEIHFALENLWIKTDQDIKEIEDLMIAINISQKIDQFQC